MPTRRAAQDRGQPGLAQYHPTRGADMPISSAPTTQHDTLPPHTSVQTPITTSATDAMLAAHAVSQTARVAPQPAHGNEQVMFSAAEVVKGGRRPSTKMFGRPATSETTEHQGHAPRQKQTTAKVSTKRAPDDEQHSTEAHKRLRLDEGADAQESESPSADERTDATAAEPGASVPKKPYKAPAAQSLIDMKKYALPNEDLDWTVVMDPKKRRKLQGLIAERKRKEKVDQEERAKQAKSNGKVQVAISKSKRTREQGAAGQPAQAQVIPVPPGGTTDAFGNIVTADQLDDIQTYSLEEEDLDWTTEQNKVIRRTKKQTIAARKKHHPRIREERAEIAQWLQEGETLKDLDWTVGRDKIVRLKLQRIIQERKDKAEAAAQQQQTEYDGASDEQSERVSTEPSQNDRPIRTVNGRSAVNSSNAVNGSNAVNAAVEARASRRTSQRLSSVPRRNMADDQTDSNSDSDDEGTVSVKVSLLRNVPSLTASCACAAMYSDC